MASTLRVERDGRVMTVLVDNPPHNFMNRHMVAELAEITDGLEDDDSVGSVVITGAPEGLFITHYDVGEILAGTETMDMEVAPAVAGATLRAVGAVSRLPGGRSAVQRTPASGMLELRAFHELFDRWNRMDKVFIAAIGGPAMGGGSELALACDLRYIADDAMIGQPEVLVGFPPGGGSTQRLARAVGTARALELILEGTAVTPTAALEMGYVHAVVPGAELRSRVAATAERLARRAPESVVGAKRALYEGNGLPLDQGLAIERKWFLAAASKPPSKKAMRAYVDEVESAGSPPFGDRERITAWQEGTAVDMLDA
jgi:enoyl-CoA hydratase/carnithine racemase